MASTPQQTNRSTSSGTLGRALLALLLAFGFWAWVTNQTDPDRMRTFENIPVTPINPPDGLAVDYNPKSVDISIWGPRSVVLSPNVQAGNFAAVIDLKDVKAGVSSVPVQINTTTKDIRKKESTPDSVQVTAERSVEKTLPVVVPTQPQPGVKVNSAVASPSEVRVDGPESAVNMVAQVIAPVDLSDRSTNFATPVDLSARDANGNMVTNVTLTPPRVTVTVDLTDQRNERTVPVNPTFSGTPAAGFQLDSLVPTPSQVTLTGDPQQLRNILNVPTEPVSVDGLKQTTTVSTHLVTSQLPSGVSVKGNVSDVQVQINISEITATAQFKPRVQPINVHQGLQATLVPEDVTVTLRGTREQLNQYGSSLAALVNLAQYTSPIGPTDVDVTIQLPPNSGLTVDKVEPKSVQVTLTTPPTPTPAPTATPLPTATPRPTTPPTVAPTPTP